MRTEYLFDKASFDGLVYDDVKFIEIKGSKFTIADPQVCLNGTTINNIKKFIEANGKLVVTT